MTKEEEEYERLVKVPKDDAEVIKLTRDWVNVIVSDMGICPFSQVLCRAPPACGLRCCSCTRGKELAPPGSAASTRLLIRDVATDIITRLLTWISSLHEGLHPGSGSL